MKHTIKSTEKKLAILNKSVDLGVSVYLVSMMILWEMK